MPHGTYDRKISSEEAREGYVLVDKSRLSFFPRVGQQFQLKFGATQRAAAVEARACACRGPEKPHEHYFIRVEGLPKGSRWSISRYGGGYWLQPACSASAPSAAGSSN